MKWVFTTAIAFAALLIESLSKLGIISTIWVLTALVLTGCILALISIQLRRRRDDTERGSGRPDQIQRLTEAANLLPVAESAVSTVIQCLGDGSYHAGTLIGQRDVLADVRDKLGLWLRMNKMWLTKSERKDFDQYCLILHEIVCGIDCLHEALDMNDPGTTIVAKVKVVGADFYKVQIRVYQIYSDRK